MFDPTVPFMVATVAFVVCMPVMMGMMFYGMVGSSFRTNRVKALRKTEDRYNIDDTEFFSDLPKFNNPNDSAQE